MGNELERGFWEMCPDFLEGVGLADNAARTLRDLNDPSGKSSGSERVQLREELFGPYWVLCCLGSLKQGFSLSDAACQGVATAYVPNKHSGAWREARGFDWVVVYKLERLEDGTINDVLVAKILRKPPTALELFPLSPEEDPHDGENPGSGN